MPYSYPQQISTLMEHIIRINPRSLLDVGCGLGVYGFLSRIHLEQYDLFDENFDVERNKNWKRRIDCIEGFPRYIKCWHEWAYDNIYLGDLMGVLDKLLLRGDRYELSICIDVIEHFTKEEGFQLLDKLEAVSEAVIVSTPKEFFEQEIEQNPLENHKSLWHPEDFTQRGYIIVEHPLSLIALREKSHPSSS
jgi:hypothetical protein